MKPLNLILWTAIGSMFGLGIGCTFAANPGLLPIWFEGNFKNASLQTNGITLAFADSGQRYMCEIQDGDIADSRLSQYGGKLEIKYGVAARLVAKSTSFEIRSLALKVDDRGQTEPADLCALMGKDRAQLWFPRTAYMLLKKTDTRSLRGKLVENRAIIVPLLGLSAEQVTVVKAQLQKQFSGPITVNTNFAYVECESITE